MSCDNKYLLQMKDVKQYSESFFKQAISSFRYFYEKTLGREWKTLRFVYPQKEKKLPDVLSIKEVRRILSHVRLPRYYAILSTLYSLGLRISEGLQLVDFSLKKTKKPCCRKCGADLILIGILPRAP